MGNPCLYYRKLWCGLDQQVVSRRLLSLTVHCSVNLYLSISVSCLMERDFALITMPGHGLLWRKILRHKITLKFGRNVSSLRHRISSHVPWLRQAGHTGGSQFLFQAVACQGLGQVCCSSRVACLIHPGKMGDIFFLSHTN